MTGPAAHILLIEDNAADVRLTEEAFRGTKSTCDLHVVGDGEEALAYLHREGRFAGEPSPDLVLLDLNLPRKDGREVLSEMKADPALRRIPVTVLTTSTSQVDIDAAYDQGANGYIVKPVDFDQFLEVITSIDLFWLRTVRLPTPRRATDTATRDASRYPR